MARSELVEKYRELVEQYDLLRQRIVKAEENRGKFKSSVVDRVVADYKSRMSELEEQLAPAEEEMFKSVDEYDQERARLEAEKEELDDAQDEVALRHVLGEYSDEVAEEKKAELETKLSDVNGRLAEIEQEVGTLKEYLEKAGAWERREAALRAAEAEAAQEPEADAVASSAPDQADSLESADHTREAAEAASPAPGDAGFEAGASTGSDAGAFDMILDDFPVSGDGSAEGNVGMSSGDGDLKGLSGLEDDQWQQNLDEEFPPADGLQDMLGSDSKPVEDDFPNLGFGDQLDVLPPLGEAAQRTAHLVRNPGTPTETRYELREDVTSIGRGRDNQIQIKDDTKVSRYHCRVLQEQGSFYVEDNNSSNGTMVNGELVTRRKLEGGEEITIGETVFRFELS